MTSDTGKPSDRYKRVVSKTVQTTQNQKTDKVSVSGIRIAATSKTEGAIKVRFAPKPQD